MVSQQQIADEQRKEAEFNKLFEQVISKSPFGQWYGLMIGASNLLTQNLQKRVGVGRDGRPIVVYKTNIGKLMGVWATPTHKVIAKDLSQGKYGEALGALLGIGQIVEMVKQQQAKFFDISPKEVQEIYARKQAAKNKKITPVTIPVAPVLNIKKTVESEEKNYTPIILISIVGVVGLVTFITYKYKN